MNDADVSVPKISRAEYARRLDRAETTIDFLEDALADCQLSLATEKARHQSTKRQLHFAQQDARSMAGRVAQLERSRDKQAEAAAEIMTVARREPFLTNRRARQEGGAEGFRAATKRWEGKTG